MANSAILSDSFQTTECAGESTMREGAGTGLAKMPAAELAFSVTELCATPPADDYPPLQLATSRV
jgi:hypothetical protein